MTALRLSQEEETWWRERPTASPDALLGAVRGVPIARLFATLDAARDETKAALSRLSEIEEKIYLLRVGP